MSEWGTRDDWKVLLPIIQAWVDGEAIDRVAYSGKWMPVGDVLNGLLHAKLRITKDAHKRMSGTWSRQYSQKLQGIFGQYETGTVQYLGHSDDEQTHWPVREWIEPPVFTPDKKGNRKDE